MLDPYKPIAPDQDMVDMRAALLEAMRPYADSVDDLRKLALLGHMVGQIIAMGNFDERIHPNMLIDMFMRNLETGNREAVEFAHGAGETRQ